jgi:hypothetical protein
VSDAALIALIAAYAAVWVGTAVVCWLKGKRLWATLGFVTGWHVIPAVRLAKPDSWWSRRFYDEQKLRLAKARFFELDAPDDYEDLAELSADEVMGMDKITRKAWEKENKRRAKSA